MKCFWGLKTFKMACFGSLFGLQTNKYVCEQLLNK